MMTHMVERVLSVLNYKSEECKHQKGCIISTIIGTLRIALTGFAVRGLISVIFSLKKIMKSPKLILSLFRSKQARSFGFFMGAFVLIYKTLTCLLKYRKTQEAIIPMVAGFCSGGVSIFILPKQSRQSFGLFLLARALDITYQHLVQQQYLPNFKYFYVVVYALMMGVTGYVFGTEPGTFSPQMNKFYLTFTNQTLNDMQMRAIWIQRKNNRLAAINPSIQRQNPIDYMPKLKKFYENKIN